MSRYRAIHCLIWNDDKFPFVSERCQLIFFHLLTTPMSTPFGLYKASLEALAAEKRLPLKAYREAFREAFAKAFVKYDERHQVILIPQFLKYNPPNNPNVLKAWKSVYDEIPDCDLKIEFYQILKAFVEGFSKAFGEAFREAWGKPLPKVSVPVSVPDTVPDTVPEKKTRRRKSNGKDEGTVLPEPFEITDSMRLWYGKNFPDYDIDKTTERWKDNARKKGWVYINWEAAWREGMWKALEFNQAIKKPIDWSTI